MAVALIASAAVKFATDAVAILAIAPASSIAQPRCMETAVWGRTAAMGSRFSGWPEFGIAVSF
jgi:hypothetical protein